MGAYSSTPEAPYTGPVYPPRRTFDIISTHGQTLAGMYEIREDGWPHYCTKLTRARHGIYVSTIHRLEDDGQPGIILAACRGSGRWSFRFGVMLGDPYVAGGKVGRHGVHIPRVIGKKMWPRIGVDNSRGRSYKQYAFEADDGRKFRIEDRHYIGSADTHWAHWALIDEEDKSKRISAVYVHVLDEMEDGKLRVGQLKLYAALGPDVEVMALAVMEGIEKLRGPLADAPKKSGTGRGGARRGKTKRQSGDSVSVSSALSTALPSQHSAPDLAQ